MAWFLSAPVYILIGPAAAVTVAALAGMRCEVDPLARDACFLVLGISVGTGFDSDAWQAMVRWPLAFLFMAVVLWLILITCRALLMRFFGFDRRSAVLASAPGHLSFVVVMASEIGADLARISIVQSVRLLSLTLIVPFIVMWMGVEGMSQVVPMGEAMALWKFPVLLAAALALGAVFKRLHVPAPLLMGAMAGSAFGQLSGLTPGVLPAWIVLPAYLVMGTLIGTRFSGVTVFDVAKGLGAGLVATTIAVGFAGLASLPVAWALGMPIPHVLVAFSPGGLETMIAMGAVLGVIPGFVAACHIARLTVLTFLLPLMVPGQDRAQPSSPDLSGTP